MALNGTSVLVYANTGTPGAPVYTVVGSQRDSKLNETVSVVDVSSKDQFQRKVLGGRYASVLDLTELYVPNDAAYTALLTSFRNRTLVLVQVFESGIVKWQGNMLISKMDRDFPDQGPAVITMAFELDGAWTTF